MAKEAGSPIGVQEKRKQKEKSLRKQNKGRRGQGDEDEIKAFQNSSEAAIENGFVGKVVSEKKGDEAPSKKVGVKLKEEPLPPNLDDSDGIKIEELAPEPGDIDAKAAKQPEIVLEREKEDPPKDIKNKEENTPEQPQENKEGENVLTQREFNQKYPDILRRNRFSKADEKKDWIYIIEYDEKTGQVEIGESGKKSKKVALKELDDFLSRYPYYGTETKDAGTKEKRKFLKIEPAPAAVSDNKKEKKKKEYNKETKEKNDSNDKKNETHKNQIME